VNRKDSLEADSRGAPWLRLLAGETYVSYSRRHALFTSSVFVQGNKFPDHPMRLIYAPTTGMVVKIPKAKGSD